MLLSNWTILKCKLILPEQTFLYIYTHRKSGANFIIHIFHKFSHSYEISERLNLFSINVKLYSIEYQWNNSIYMLLYSSFLKFSV